MFFGLGPRDVPYLPLDLLLDLAFLLLHVLPKP